MTNDFRALCAELVDIITAHANPDDYAVGDVAEMLARARAALAKADEPAVPEGREPAAVTGQPSDEEWDALVERVWDKYQTVGYQGERFMYEGDFGSALDLVRKELARWGNLKGSPTSSSPADGEVTGLVEELNELAYDVSPYCVTLLRRAAELLQRQVLVPVPVSERLPGSEDCDDQGRCWAGTRAFVDTRGDRDIDYPLSWELREVCAQDDVWLHAHALPLP